jgi:hypothetical protein
MTPQAAVIPAAKYKLLSQCLDTTLSREERDSLVEVYVESTFTTDIVMHSVTSPCLVEMHLEVHRK